MKNYIDDLSKKNEVRKMKELEIQKDIDSLESKKQEIVKKKQEAFNSQNQNEYLALHNEIRGIDGDIDALKSFLKDTQQTSVKKSEVITAWSKTIESFEKDRKAKVNEYLRLKKTLARMCKEFWSEEKKMRELQDYARSLGKIDFYSGELSGVPVVEGDFKTSCFFFKDEFKDLGFGYQDIITGNY